MPRRSLRDKILRAIKAYKEERAARIAVKQSLLIDSSDEILVDTISVLLNEAVENAHEKILNSRYTYRNSYRKGYSDTVFKRVLEEDDSHGENTPWLLNEEFIQNFRMHRGSFNKLVLMIEKHDVFISNGKKQQAPVSHQLLVLLMYLGTSGSGASNSRLRSFLDSDAVLLNCIEIVVWLLYDP
jgi:hypothetical protein